MTYQSLYRTWRPQKFSQMVGQKAIVRALSNQAASKRVAHAYLFCGSRGTGKTSAARIMAMAINCEQPQNGDPCLECTSCKALGSETTLDVFEMDAASNSRVEEIREMLSRTDYPPQFVHYKVYIIDEVHMLSNAAFNALLKTLEEPPEYMVFILATTEPQKLPATILSRCQRFDFGRISEQEIISRLKMALQEGLSAEEDALQLIAASAQGSMRDAWSLMDMCLGIDSNLTEANVRYALGSVSQGFLYEFLDMLQQGNTAQALRLTDDLMKGGRDVQVFLREFNAHLRQVLAVKWTGEGIRDITRDQARRLKAQAETASADLLLFFLEKCMQAEQDARWTSSPRAVLELFALRSTQLQQENDHGAVLARLGALEKRAEKIQQPSGGLRADHEQPVPSLPEQMPSTPVIAEDKPAAPLNMEPSAEVVLGVKGAPDSPADQQPTQLTPVFTNDSPASAPTPEAAGNKPLQALAATPKDAWNNMLKRLSRDNPGLHAMVYRGKYGGYEKKVFTLLLEKEDDILSVLLNDQSRSAQISRILSEEVGTDVRFAAIGALSASLQPKDHATDENIEALAKEFGRDKIVVKKS